MVIIDGRATAQKILNKIKTDLNGRSISIAAIWAGENLAIGHFIAMKKKYAESVGIKMVIFNFESNDSENNIVLKIKELSDNKDIDGIIVELPLPDKFNRDKILNSIPEEKDIDILSASAQENFYNNSISLLPPSVEALDILLKECEIDTRGKTAAVFGQSILIGKPISYWLEQMGAKVFRIDENTNNPEELCLQADIVVSGVGKPNLIHGDMIKKGAVVVDFGFEKLNEKTTGDVDFNSVASKISLITPVPGGMGPIVIAAFLKNAVEISQNSLLK